MLIFNVLISLVFMFSCIVFFNIVLLNQADASRSIRIKLKTLQYDSSLSEPEQMIRYDAFFLLDLFGSSTKFFNFFAPFAAIIATLISSYKLYSQVQSVRLVLERPQFEWYVATLSIMLPTLGYFVLKRYLDRYEDWKCE